MTGEASPAGRRPRAGKGRKAKRGRRALPQISTSQAEWEQIGELAARKGKSRSRYLVDCGLSVDPGAEPPHRFVIGEAQQWELLDLVRRVSDRVLGTDLGKSETLLEEIAAALDFLVEVEMRRMVDRGEAAALEEILSELFGAEMARETMAGLAARDPGPTRDGGSGAPSQPSLPL